MSKTTNKIDAKAKFNALQNARHIFALKEEGVVFKLVELIKGAENCKAVIITEDGEISALFTDSVSATQSLQEVITVFGDDQPFIKVNIRETAKKQSVYFVEVQ